MNRRPVVRSLGSNCPTTRYSGGFGDPHPSDAAGELSITNIKKSPYWILMTWGNKGYIMPSVVIRGFEIIVTKHFSSGALNRLTLTSLMGIFDVPFNCDGVITLVTGGDQDQSITDAPALRNAIPLAKGTYLSTIEQLDQDGKAVDQGHGLNLDVAKIETILFEYNMLNRSGFQTETIF